MKLKEKAGVALATGWFYGMACRYRERARKAPDDAARAALLSFAEDIERDIAVLQRMCGFDESESLFGDRTPKGTPPVTDR
jgi:hypothetical protein